MSPGSPSTVRRADVTSSTERDGVRLAYRIYGDGDITVVLMPTWSIIDSRLWKAQVAWLARHHRVITFDGRGSGESGRPAVASAYTDEQYADDTLAVLDATDTERAVLVSLSCAAAWTVRVAANHPERVLGLFVLSPSCGLDVPSPGRGHYPWDEPLDSTDGWAKYNKYYWLEHCDDFLDFFFTQMFNEDHSTKQIEDAVSWASEVAPETLVTTTAGRMGFDGVVTTSFEPLCARVSCPVTVVHGTADAVRSHAVGERLAELTGGSLVLLEGAGHGIMGRHPVQFNLLLRDFLDRFRPPPALQTWAHPSARPRKALFLSSPIGLGHARRDLAVAEELQKLHPELQIDWLTQHPVTSVLEAAGQRIHPASRWLANESQHFEHEAGEHDLHAFQAIRSMDEILVNNFMVFQELVESEHYDLVVGDEAWDLDHFLHENPELKRFAFAWMTDFVGWLPMPDGGDREARLTADYNAEMLEQRARLARIRDRSIFVGNPEDVVREQFGPGLPMIDEWVRANFDFAGYVTGFDTAGLADRAALRARLGHRDDERLCVVTVGGSGVGAPLLRRVLDAVPLVRREADDLRFLLVAGPRIDPRSLPGRRGVNVRGHVPKLYRHLAAADLAVVQGGLTTCMELAAVRRPFLYVPLRNHFEQNFHVRHRLERYAAGQHLDYDVASDPDGLAAAILEGLGQSVSAIRPVETDGAARAARMLAELL